MSYLKRLKVKVNYEQNIARCKTCKHIVWPHIKLLTNSATKKVDRHCGLHGFIVAPVDICDSWQSANGEILE